MVRTMSYDLSILRAMLRLARRREAADVEALELRVGGDPSEVRASLRRLAAGGYVERLGATGARLTMEGLAVAVATVAAVKRKSSAPVKKRSSRAA
jgi:Mn-dependent DtxR family transcriptional regulator